MPVSCLTACGASRPHAPGSTFGCPKADGKGAQGVLPLENPEFRVLSALRPNWFDSPESAYPPSAARGAVIRRSAERLAQRRKRRLSTHELYRRFLLWHIGAVQVYCASAQRVPDADSTPLRGRQAELVDRQSPRSEPRRRLLVHGAPQLFTCRRVRKTPVYFGGPGGHPRRLFGYFLCVQKVTRWHLCHRASRSAQGILPPFLAKRGIPS